MKELSKYLNLLLFTIAASGVLYLLSTILSPFFKYSNDFYLDKRVQTYNNISLKDGNYRLGFYIGKINIIGEKNDGEYILEYSCNNKIIRTTKNIHAKRYDEEVYYDGQDWHTMIFIDEFNIPNDINCNKFSLKITTEKNFSLFNKLKIKSPTTFYIRSSEYAAKFEKTLKQERKKFRKKYPNDFENYPIKEVEDNNHTKQALINALLDKDLKTFQHLQEKEHLNIDIELGEDKFGSHTKRTPLFYASYLNDLQTVVYLIKHKADIHHKDFIKKTPLQYAIENNSTQTVEYLLNNGAKIDEACFVHEYEKGTGKVTPLTYAIKNEFYELAKLLLEKGFRKIDLDCKGIDLYGDDSAFGNAWAKVEGFKRYKVDKSSKNPFEKETKVHIYSYLYRMQYPLRFLKLYKKYGLKDEEYENKHTKEWLKKDYDECKTGLYRGRCVFVNDENITLEEYDIFKFFELIGKRNREKNNNTKE